MAAIKGRRKRAPATTATLYARVAPETWAKAHTAAGALGVSVAAYIEAVLARDVLDERGLPKWSAEVRAVDQEELPLPKSA